MARRASSRQRGWDGLQTGRRGRKTELSTRFVRNRKRRQRLGHVGGKRRDHVWCMCVKFSETLRL